DWIIIPGGNLGNVSALGAGLTMMQELGIITKLPRICVAQAQAANPLYTSYKHGFESFAPMVPQSTLASAIQIGNPVSVQKAVRTLKKFNGVVEQASEAELADAAARSDSTGMFSCPHTGVALAALEKLAGNGTIKKGDSVVVISTANGLKFTDFKVGYHESKLPGVPNPKYANTPVLLPNDYTQVRDSVRKVLGT
ncbi:MAG TPA: pyridoxal-phosphate dependent enzyme, partial [Polyangia bacterium]|nr:pyridoxal-phosphate dependent enzyme [Polyangia bacterium]